VDLFYTKDHDWIAIEGGVATIGITDYAQAQLGDILFVQLPPPGTPLEKGKEAALVESIKAASDVYSPVTGTVREINAAIERQPALINLSPEREGWFFRVDLSDLSELKGLLTPEAYWERVKRL
jgi:glycine cleavage system H protein